MQKSTNQLKRKLLDDERVKYSNAVTGNTVTGSKAKIEVNFLVEWPLCNMEPKQGHKTQ